jgi:hypothetical protein
MTDLERQRESLKHRYNQLSSRWAEATAIEQSAIIDEMTAARERLTRTYHIGPVGRMRQLIYAIRRLRKLMPSRNVRVPRGRAVMQLNQLWTSLSQRISDSNHSSIEITRENIAQWVGLDTLRALDWEPSTAFRKLNRMVHFKPTKFVSGTYACGFWCDATRRDRIQISAIVRMSRSAANSTRNET